MLSGSVERVYQVRSERFSVLEAHRESAETVIHTDREHLLISHRGVAGGLGAASRE